MHCALKVRTIFYLLDSKQTVQHHRLCYGVIIMVLMQVYGFLRKCKTTPLTKCMHFVTLEESLLVSKQL